MTALNDAIGKTINDVNQFGTNVVVLIQTDGQENSSKEYKLDRIKSLIKEKEKLGWEFNFVGAGLDAFNQGAAYGMFNNVHVSATNLGVKDSFGFLESQCSNYRNNQQSGGRTVTTATTTTIPFRSTTFRSTHSVPVSYPGHTSYSRGHIF